MLQSKPTEHLMGITILGDYNDFSELVDSIYRITGPEEGSADGYYGVQNRLLGLCYDIRHAYQGDRDVVLVDNNMDKNKMKWHEMITPEQNVYYSVEVMFPEAIFIAASVPEMYLCADRYYGSRADKLGTHIPPTLFSNLMRDKANLDVLCSVIWQALGKVIGDDELEKVIHSYHLSRDSYIGYATQYIDKCNIELYKTPVDKRKDKLRNIAKRIVKKPQAYFSMEQNLKYWAKEYKTSIYELKDPRLEYPEEMEW
jgi:hypothetical protein